MLIAYLYTLPVALLYDKRINIMDACMAKKWLYLSSGNR